MKMQPKWWTRAQGWVSRKAAGSHEEIAVVVGPQFYRFLAWGVVELPFRLWAGIVDHLVNIGLAEGPEAGTHDMVELTPRWWVTWESRYQFAQKLQTQQIRVQVAQVLSPDLVQAVDVARNIFREMSTVRSTQASRQAAAICRDLDRLAYAMATLRTKAGLSPQLHVATDRDARVS